MPNVAPSPSIAYGSLSGPSASWTWRRSSSLCRTATPSWWPPCTRPTPTWSSGRNSWQPIRRRRRDWESRWARRAGEHLATPPRQSHPVKSSQWQLAGDPQDWSWLAALDVKVSRVCHGPPASSDTPANDPAGLIQCWLNGWLGLCFPTRLLSQSVQSLRQAPRLPFLLCFQWSRSSVGGVPALPLHGSSGISLDSGPLITNFSALQCLYPIPFEPACTASIPLFWFTASQQPIRRSGSTSAG